MSMIKTRELKKLERRYSRLLGQLQQLQKVERKFSSVQDSSVYASLVDRRERVEAEATKVLSEINFLRSS